MLIRIFLILFSIFAVSRVANRYLRKEMSIFMFLTWSFLWVGVLLAAVVPEATSYLANAVGVGRGADLVLYISVIIIFYLIFRIYGKIHQTEKQITKIVSHLAIKEDIKKKD